MKEIPEFDPSEKLYCLWLVAPKKSKRIPNNQGLLNCCLKLFFWFRARGEWPRLTDRLLPSTYGSSVAETTKCQPEIFENITFYLLPCCPILPTWSSKSLITSPRMEIGLKTDSRMGGATLRRFIAFRNCRPMPNSPPAKHIQGADLKTAESTTNWPPCSSRLILPRGSRCTAKDSVGSRASLALFSSCFDNVACIIVKTSEACSDVRVECFQMIQTAQTVDKSMNLQLAHSKWNRKRASSKLAGLRSESKSP